MRDGNGTVAAAPGMLNRVGRSIDRLLGGCAAIILFLLMLVTFVDVFGRDVFNAPLPGAFEITEIMMAALIFAALPVVSRREDHVVVDLLDAATPPAAARVRQVIMNLAGAAVLGVIAWRTWTLAAELAGYNEVTEYLQIRVAPVVYAIAILSALAAFVHVGNAWRYLKGRDARHADPATG